MVPIPRAEGGSSSGGGVTLTSGIVGTATLVGSFTPQAEAQVKPKRRNFTPVPRRRKPQHIGPGPVRPIYIPPEEHDGEFSALSHASDTYGCPDGTCGHCFDQHVICAGRYAAGGGNYYCYNYIVEDYHCASCGTFSCGCAWNQYCSRSTYWGRRCSGPAGCV